MESTLQQADELVSGEARLLEDGQHGPSGDVVPVRDDDEAGAGWIMPDKREVTALAPFGRFDKAGSPQHLNDAPGGKRRQPAHASVTSSGLV